MAGAVGELYSALLQRETELLPAIIDRISDDASPESVWLHLSRFALLAAAPTEHSRHALLATLEAKSYADDPSLFRLALLSVAKYLSVSRLPWSEAPILEPLQPVGDVTMDSLVSAAKENRRVDLERGLDVAMSDVTVLFAAARLVDDELEHQSIVAGYVHRLIDERPDLRREAIRAIAVDWLGAGNTPTAPEPPPVIEAAEKYIGSNGDVEWMHALLAADARMPSRRIPIDADVRTIDYDLARDYAAAFLAVPVAHRLSHLIGDPLRSRIIDAALLNLSSGPSYAEWLFA